MQGIPVITRFLAQYLPLWNERDYFAEVIFYINYSFCTFFVKIGVDFLYTMSQCPSLFTEILTDKMKKVDSDIGYISSEYKYGV